MRPFRFSATMMKTLCILTYISVTNVIFFTCAVQLFQEDMCQALSASAPLNFTGLAEKCGFQSEEYKVTTEDGYILGLFRVPGNNQGLPILLMHGVTDSSDTWLLRGYNSLGIALARKNYDVWFGNVRGNRYSRRHVKLNPDKDASFWNFSFHEHGFYDLPAIIDAILKNTGFQQVNVIAHSQGNMIFYILGSTRPKYNGKINVMTALAPISFLNHVHSPLSLLAQISPEINENAERLGVNELFGNSPTGRLVQLLCNNPIYGYAICTMGLLFPLSGFDVEEFSPTFFYKLLQSYPAATSRKNLYHFAQLIIRGRFSQFDYGAEGNVKEYNAAEPPEYDLDKVTMPIILMAGRNDQLSVLADVETLKARLPNVSKYIIDKRKLMNHMDFVWGEHMEDYLFSYIFDILDEYK